MLYTHKKTSRNTHTRAHTRDPTLRVHMTTYAMVFCRAAYQSALRIDENNLAGLVNYGTLLRGLGEVDAAVANFERAVRANPKVCVCACIFCVFFWRVGASVSVCIDVYMFKSHTHTHTHIHTQIAEAHYNLADVLFAKGEFYKALEKAEIAVRVKPGTCIHAHTYIYMLPAQSLCCYATNP